MITLLFTTSLVQASQTPACNTEQHRAFDFWLGNWQVFKADGSLAGSNRISLAQNGCVLTEQYRTPGGFNGQSLNMFDSNRGLWHQTWVDNSGSLLLLEGNIVDNDMLLSGAITTAEGEVQQQRIRWTPNQDGSIRQHWQAQMADGNWVTLFDGLYKKVADHNKEGN
ncbi:MAG: hypothetical protein KKE30_11925 [Gammaproteobacteria bacterium]|nr:hypothetical protein [Gammaproteobacteria bacterium]MBU1556709.1 hypothetical protein [Gammaproteobacteria bacterium]MBU2071174.1 hypothetical protein [Gammaproteobacteria bacterium]MBU2184376.1 hypothetical protein [Gammaproteobacteria bacterium]MBU2206242.1 hypothetical protein [Gammaproteobacteria bacterium]